MGLGGRRWGREGEEKEPGGVEGDYLIPETSRKVDTGNSAALLPAELEPGQDSPVNDALRARARVDHVVVLASRLPN